MHVGSMDQTFTKQKADITIANENIRLIYMVSKTVNRNWNQIAKLYANLVSAPTWKRT